MSEGHASARHTLIASDNLGGALTSTPEPSGVQRSVRKIQNSMRADSSNLSEREFHVERRSTPPFEGGVMATRSPSTCIVTIPPYNPPASTRLSRVPTATRRAWPSGRHEQS